LLYFVPTPIGNLDDITVRGLRLLTTTSLIFCEDTRNTKKLITLLKEKHNIQNQIEQKFISFHSHNEQEIIKELNPQEFLNKDFLYVSDAGMPCISDPGNLLVKFAQDNNIKYEVLPGANAALLALVASGFDGSDFYFYGFLPHKSEARKSAYKKILDFTCNVIIYESTHRIVKSIEDLKNIEPNREIFVIKEATKKYEIHFLGSVLEVYEKLKTSNLNGEYAIVIKGKGSFTKIHTNLDENDILPLNIPNKQKAKLLSKITGISSNKWYDRLTKE
jgi:16S rRNA (cytidine1402-2'-O)-methyltransferase